MNREANPGSAVVIGASVGAIDALLRILPELPPDQPDAVLIVVHLPRNKDSLLADIFGQRCAMRVKEAEDKERLEAGTIYFAPPDYHLMVNPDLTVALSSDEAVNFSRPSVDVLFESAAAVFGDGLTGIVLTGSNDDGAEGLRAVEAAGGRVVVQSPDSAENPSMPSAALAACASATILNAPEIGTYLKERPIL